MSNLLEVTKDILVNSYDYLKLPEVKGAVSGFLSWLGSKVFSNKKASLDRLALLEHQKADAETIATLGAN